MDLNNPQNADDQDLFLGTADYYAEYRPPYPPELLAGITDAGEGRCRRLLDIGCGTGELALPLATAFATVTAVDVDPDMVRLARRKADESGVTNVELISGRAEDLVIEPGSWDCVTAGSSFHWMDRELLSHRIYEALPSGHKFFIVGGGSSPWSGSTAWQQTVVEVITKWLGEQRRAGTGVYAVDRTHEDFLVPAGFDVKKVEHRVTLSWTVDRVLGYLSSTSFANRAVLGERHQRFETELRSALAQLERDDSLVEDATYYLLSAAKP